MVEKLHQGICELVPELPLPEVLKVQHKGLELLCGLVPLLGEEVGDRIDIHLEDSARVRLPEPMTEEEQVTVEEVGLACGCQLPAAKRRCSSREVGSARSCETN